MTQDTLEQTMQLAVQHHQAGRLADAEKLYRQVLQQQPDHVESLRLLGMLAHQAGELDVAIELIRRAIAINPANALCNNNLAYLLREKGEVGEAIAACRRAIALQPDYAEAFNNLGNSLRDRGEFEEAIRACQQAVRLRPDFAEAYNNLGNALREKRRLDEAIGAYRQAARIRPDLAEVHSNLGNTLLDRGLYAEAIGAYQQALRRRPNSAKDFSSLGNALCETGQLEEALAACRQALKLKPEFADAHHDLSIVLKEMGQIEEAIAACRRAIALRPDSAIFHGNLLLLLHYQENFNANSLYAETIEWARRHADSLAESVRPHINERSPERRLKIGYVSADFRDHPVGRFVLPLLSAHDPAEVEIFGYADVADPDAVTERIRGAAQHWRSAVGMNNSELAQQIREDRIDILVDLAGHTAGNRLLAFAHKPAPIQITWLGYPDTTGLAMMDYRLTDALADPPGLSDATCRERLIRLPHTAWCFSAPADGAAPLRRSMGDSRPITFGSFNNLSKITPAILELWAEILRRTPDSRLMIKAKALGCETVRQRILEIMHDAGVAAERLELQGWRKSQGEHLASYHDVDIALDTFPYHGTTTTCEALWMGAAVVTLAGDAHVSRVGVSLLSNIGLANLIGQSPAEYVRIAVDLATKPGDLKAIRLGLRQRMLDSPLMDARGFARAVEAAYRHVWKAWCRS